MNIQNAVALSDFSSFGIGGNADFFVEIRTTDELLSALDFAESQKLPIFFLGGGSNILFSEKGFRGIVFHFCQKKIEFLGEQICAESGATNAEIFRFAQQHGRDFSDFLTVPGTIGGALVGNAGTPSADIGDRVMSAELFDLTTRKWRSEKRDFFEFSYRHSILREKKNLLVWRVFLHLPKSSAKEIDKKAKEFVSLRQQKQPWGKTGGSFFKNPLEGAAGYFLDQAGFRGKKIGGAFFSEKHANFLMNDGNATQVDALKLARNARLEVLKKFGVHLENEVRILDELGREVKL